MKPVKQTRLYATVNTYAARVNGATGSDKNFRSELRARACDGTHNGRYIVTADIPSIREMLGVAADGSQDNVAVMLGERVAQPHHTDTYKADHKVKLAAKAQDAADVAAGIKPPKSERPFRVFMRNYGAMKAAQEAGKVASTGVTDAAVTHAVIGTEEKVGEHLGILSGPEFADPFAGLVKVTGPDGKVYSIPGHLLK